MGGDEQEASGNRNFSAILTIAAILLVIGLTWRGCWYATALRDSEIETLLKGDGPDNQVQKALSQVKARIHAKDASVEKFFPLVAGLADHRTPQIRSTAAWVMGATKHEPFRAPLLELLTDEKLPVRYNAAVSLASRDDPAGRGVLREMLELAAVRSPVAGTFKMPRRIGANVRLGTIVGRVDGEGGQAFDVVAPVDGRISKLRVKHGGRVEADGVILDIAPPAGQIENALIALARVGLLEDIAVAQRIVEGHLQAHEGGRRLATKTIEAIRERAKKD